MSAGLLVGLLVAVVTAAPQAGGTGDEVRFTAGPTTSIAADGMRIEFAVNQPTDVAVRILDSKGRPVRHLVAGLLGANPPPPSNPAH